jgi:hypothetical protein
MTKKSTIARLLSEENINVVHKKADTASFNIKTRELVLPIFKEEMSNDLYDMFVCHEVGHALWTPMDMIERGMHQGIDHSVINVIEDARIEKMFMDKYPGSVKNFQRGYKELIEKDFFQIKDKDLSQLNIIDKINIFYKTGMIGTVTETEQSFIDEVATVKTVEDVISLAARLCDYHEEQQQENQDSSDDQSEQDQQEENEQQSEQEQSQSSQSQDQSEQSEQSQKEEEGDDKKVPSKSIPKTDQEDTEKLQEEKEDTVGSQGAGKDVKGDLKSSTDNAYQNALNQTKDEDAKDREYINLPKNFDVSKVTISFKKVLEDLQKDYANYHSKSFTDYIEKDFQKVFEENKKAVQYMVKEFEMKKSADQYKRATVSKTGTLDMGKLHTYKFNDDLFAKMTNIPGSTDHGMIMYLDWSGSMVDNMRFTLIQLFNLIWFCQRVNIPFQVLAFSNRNQQKAEKVQEVILNDFAFQDFTLIEFFSSQMSKVETQFMMKQLLSMCFNWRGKELPFGTHPTYIPSTYNLGGTPLNTAIFSAYYIAKKFQQTFKVQKLNFIFLTDGDSHAFDTVFNDQKRSIFGDERYTSTIVPHSWFGKDWHVTCKNTNKKIVMTNFRDTEDFLELLRKQIPDATVTGFYVAGTGKSGRVPLRVILNKYRLREYDDKDKIIKIQTELRKNKVAICKQVGYDEYYILPRGSMDEEEEQLTFKKNAKTAGMAREFIKHASKKTVNRQLLRKFIEKVA